MPLRLNRVLDIGSKLLFGWSLLSVILVYEYCPFVKPQGN